MSNLSNEYKLEKIYKVVELLKITGYEIAKYTNLSEAGVGKILNKSVKKPHKHTIEAIYNYVIIRENSLNEEKESYNLPISQPEIKAHQNTLLESVNIFIDKLESKKNKDITDLQDLKEAIKLKSDIQKELDLL